MAAAAATAAATLGSAGIGYLSNRSANNANRRASDAALTFERQRYADTKAAQDRAWADYERRRDTWDTGRRAILAHYGINIPGMGGGGAPTGGAGGAPAAIPVPGGGGGGGGGMSMAPPPMTDGGEEPMGDGTVPMADWANWGNYGVR